MLLIAAAALVAGCSGDDTDASASTQPSVPVSDAPERPAPSESTSFVCPLTLDDVREVFPFADAHPVLNVEVPSSETLDVPICEMIVADDPATPMLTVNYLVEERPIADLLDEWSHPDSSGPQWIVERIEDSSDFFVRLDSPDSDIHVHIAMTQLSPNSTGTLTVANDSWPDATPEAIQSALVDLASRIQNRE